MKLTKETLKRIIKEELQATLREENRDKVSLVKSLNNAVYSLDQGTSTQEVEEAKETIATIQKKMSPQDFKIAKELADLYVYYAEYATRADVEQTKSKMAALCAKLGITLDDLI
jgi:HD-like signal output (HDOD) protein